ncbi:hypothetical protein JYU20_04635, partial [Bacteroidales bacterium AH-315-I05]|nr:hypothetical protein [Bacteroidales bacterium AH-315-I05]
EENDGLKGELANQNALVETQLAGLKADNDALKSEISDINELKSKVAEIDALKLELEAVKSTLGMKAKK